MKNRYLDAGKLLQDLSDKENPDLQAVIYLCELYKKITCIALRFFKIPGFTINMDTLDEYEENLPELCVFESENGEIKVWLNE